MLALLALLVSELLETQGMLELLVLPVWVQQVLLALQVWVRPALREMLVQLVLQGWVQQDLLVILETQEMLALQALQVM